MQINTLTSMSEYPPCFRCGYDLTGLALPCTCPECGHHADPEREAEEARGWFASRQARFYWLMRPGKVPPALLYTLNDQGSMAIARRRALAWVWLPIVLITAVVALWFQVTIEFQVTKRYYERGDPQKRVLREFTGRHVDRVFAFNLHMDDLLFTPPPSWAWEVERVGSGVCVRRAPWRDYLDPLPLVLVGVPWIGVLFGLVTTRWIAAGWPRRDEGIGEARRRWPVHCTTSLICPSLGALLWMWLAAVGWAGAAHCHPDGPSVLSAWTLVALVIGWLVLTIIVWPVLVSLDRGGRVFSSRWRWALGLTAVAFAAPAVAVRAMVWLLNRM